MGLKYPNNDSKNTSFVVITTLGNLNSPNAHKTKVIHCVIVDIKIPGYRRALIIIPGWIFMFDKCKFEKLFSFTNSKEITWPFNVKNKQTANEMLHLILPLIKMFSWRMVPLIRKKIAITCSWVVLIMDTLLWQDFRCTYKDLPIWCLKLHSLYEQHLESNVDTKVLGQQSTSSTQVIGLYH